MGLQTVASAGRFEVIDERGEQPCPGRAERVAECDGPAQWVELGGIGAQFVRPCQRDGREGLVHPKASRSSMPSPARSRTLRVAGIGAVSIISGSSPSTANEWIRREA